MWHILVAWAARGTIKTTARAINTTVVARFGASAGSLTASPSYVTAVGIVTWAAEATWGCAVDAVRTLHLVSILLLLSMESG